MKRKLDLNCIYELIVSVNVCRRPAPDQDKQNTSRLTAGGKRRTSLLQRCVFQATRDYVQDLTLMHMMTVIRGIFVFEMQKENTQNCACVQDILAKYMHPELTSLIEN